jgi:hypothetical protein
MIAFIVRSNHIRLGLLLALALISSIWSTESRAYTAEEEQACSGDAFRLCSSEIPDVDRVGACMARKQSQLSPGCRAYFRPEPELTPAAAGRPLGIQPDHPRRHGIKSRKSKKSVKRS